MPSARGPGVLDGFTGAPPAVPGDTAEARAARERLVAHIAAHHDVSAVVLDAMRKVPRQLFVDAPLQAAYQDNPLRIAHGQAISQPHIVAIMTDALELRGDERVLEIGTGSGYQAAILSLLAGHVDSIEILPALADSARARLCALGYLNVEVRTGNGHAGWPEHAPFERILLTASPPEIPRVILDQLGEGGVLVGPVGEHSESQRLLRWRRRASRLLVEDLGGVSFVPMVAR
jgi:protein-L-isoaspartate(D-aspartate) O-methyltransferase